MRFQENPRQNFGTAGRKIVTGILLLLIVAVNAYAWLIAKPQAVAGFAVPPAAGAAPAERPPLFQVRFASSSLDDFVHSPSIAPLPDGGLMAVWFAGSREGASDVDIRAARFDPARQEWSDEFTLVSRQATQAAVARYVRKLGNPVIALAPDHRLWLFYVSVSVGGWGGSAINAMHSEDGGKSWSEPQRLITSPFLNISTLVRNPPVFHQDGSIGLPVYHEFLGKFPEYLLLSPEGEVLDKFRISSGRHSLQPTVVPLTGDSAVALLRNAGLAPGKVLATFTHDRGRTWSEPAGVEPNNPNSALSAVRSFDQDEILVVLNNLADGRHRLSLVETDARLARWELVKILDQSPGNAGEMLPQEAFRTAVAEDFLAVCDPEGRGELQEFLPHLEERACRGDRGCRIKYDYPTFLTGADGLFHVVYSWNNSFVKHVTFNRAWLEKQQWIPERFSAALPSR